jgi:Putative Ig domain
VDTITYPEPPVITTTSPLPQGTVGLPYTTSLAATSGAGATNTWSLQSGQLPAGLTLNADGVISGTPTSAGTSTVVVGVDDPVTATLSITIAAAPGTPVISSTPTAGATTTALTTPSTLAVSGAMLGPELLGGTLLVTLGSALLVMRRLRRRTATPATN